MGADEEKSTTFGATVVQPSDAAPPASDAPSKKTPPALSVPPAAAHLSTPSTREQSLDVSRTPTGKDSDLDLSNPFSAFYTHDTPSRQTHALPESAMAPTSKTNLDVYHPDVEGQPMSACTTQTHKQFPNGGKQCTMWPSRQTLIDEAKARKHARGGCHPLRGLTKRQRLWVKIVIALFIVAAAVGVGVGVSKAVGAGVWSGDGQSRQIGEPEPQD